MFLGTALSHSRCIGQFRSCALGVFTFLGGVAMRLLQAALMKVRALFESGNLCQKCMFFDGEALHLRF